MEYKTFQSEVKEADEAELSVEHWISTTERDRQGDEVVASGMKMLGRPVVLWGHGHGSGGAEPIGKPLWIKPATYKGKTGILAKTLFFDDEQGRRLWRKVKEGFLHSWSIGFIPLRSEPLEGGGRRILEFDLLEYSLVATPACAGATTLGADVGGLFFKIMPPGETCGCGGDCKGLVKCGGHKDKRPPRLRFEFVSSAPPKANLEEVAAVAREVIQEHVRKELRHMQGKVD